LRSAPSGKSRREAAYPAETTAVAVRLTANHQPRKIQSELVGTAMTMVTRRTKPIDAATGSP
jgi:hypothetical protein